MSTLLPEEVQQRPVKSRRRPPAARKLFDPSITRQAVKDSFIKLNPVTLIRNPVMFVVEVGSVVTTVLFLRDLGSSTSSENVFAGLVSPVAVVHGAVRQLRRGHGGGAGQGSGGHAPPDQGRDGGQGPRT